MKFFSFLRSGSVHPSSRKHKIIPSEEFSSLMSAKELLESAEQEIAEIKKETKDQAREDLAAAKKKGLKQGLDQFTELLMHFDRQLKELRHEMNTMILPLALKAARKIVVRQLQLSPETIVDIVLQALSPITENRHVILYVNKDDKAYLDKEKEKLMQALAQVESFSIQESKDVEPGGCRIWTETGFLNVELENQWKALEKAFARYMNPKEKQKNK